MQLLGRFLYYEEGKEKIKEIVNIIKQKYSHWNKNKYYKQRNIIYKTTYKIFYTNNMFIINIYNKIRRKIKEN